MFNSAILGSNRKEVSKLSKKNKPGDGTHGKGKKGMKHEEFGSMFETKARQDDGKESATANDSSES